MADKLMRYYEYINQEAGFSGKVKLAQMTKVPSTQAAMQPETQEILQQFKEAIRQITGKAAPGY